MNLNHLSEFVMEKMKRELPANIVYHSTDHTRDVYESAMRLAFLEKLDEPSTRLLGAAALFHDIGITVRFEDHETNSAAIAGEYLPSFGFNAEDIGAIQSMILATRLPQQANTLAEKILCDADLDYLGRRDFFVIGQKLRLEWELSGKPVTLSDWYILQMKFLKSHQYFTASATKLRNEVKLQNLKEIETLCTRRCTHI
ncbi:MAG: HD domain-containing protein [Lentimicrobium sp.]|jgi:predicted metal-dependent HD superfamily phosphohydrolase|nr:HD domain-containing protein [Lentimicrobium sp.]MDD2528828.1 HD domain-containing protein [Lentimicrobiaceae bacterium]MDD4597780.1 HD domain-containing protein [Lentimicrobiaceae bacterium]MDY0025461.1 HD domain-containing protein [Lentimicrobium sp.]HAH58835.1 metal-dependent phosphohydrolase [Bacteroidales bacterium]